MHDGLCNLYIFSLLLVTNYLISGFNYFYRAVKAINNVLTVSPIL